MKEVRYKMVRNQALVLILLFCSNGEEFGAVGYSNAEIRVQ